MSEEMERKFRSNVYPELNNRKIEIGRPNVEFRPSHINIHKGDIVTNNHYYAPQAPSDQEAKKWEPRENKFEWKPVALLLGMMILFFYMFKNSEQRLAEIRACDPERIDRLQKK